MPALAGAAPLDEIEALQRQHRIPALAFALARDGAVSATVLGVPPATAFRWGSITKTFTALTVLNMAQDRLVDLHAPLTALIGGADWRNRWRATQPVRVLQLLELTAGFPDLSRSEFDHAEPVSLRQALALAPEHRATRWPPGLQHSYSNMTPGLTQLLIERVSGTDYPHAVERFVLSRLGMRDSGFTPREDLAGGFRADGTTPIPYWHMTFPAYGALNAPLADMRRLLAAMLARTVFGAPVWRRLLQPSTSLAARRLGFRFDYAAGLYPRVRRGHVWHTHGGDADGYRSRIAIMDDHDRGYVAAINTDNPRALRELEAILERFLTAGIERPRPPDPARLAQASLSRLSGRYYPSSTRFRAGRWRAGELEPATIAVDGDRLAYTRGSREISLIPLSPALFRREADPVATVAFVEDPDGALHIQGALGNFVRLDGACPAYLGVACQPNFSAPPAD